MSNTAETKEHTPILMTEEYWANSPFSVVRYQGQIRIRGVEYIIVNREGKDIFECSWEAHRAGRSKAIEPGEPCDLIDIRYKPIYRKVGRDTFIKWLEEGLEMEQMKERLAKMKEDDARKHKEIADRQTTMEL